MYGIELTGADITAIITALTGLVVAIGTLVKAFGIGREVTAVHTAVNSNLTAAQIRTEQLTSSLTDAGVPVPPHPPVVPPTEA